MAQAQRPSRFLGSIFCSTCLLYHSKQRATRAMQQVCVCVCVCLVVFVFVFAGCLIYAVAAATICATNWR